MNTYRIPSGGRTPEEYNAYVGSLLWVWLDTQSLNVDYMAETVSANAVLSGFDLVPPPVEVAAAASRMLDKDVFIERFSPVEYAGIKALRTTNPVVDWLMAVLEAKSGQVNLASPRLAGGLAYIESLPDSPLAAGRAVQITGD